MVSIAMETLSEISDRNRDVAVVGRFSNDRGGQSLVCSL